MDEIKIEFETTADEEMKIHLKTRRALAIRNLSILNDTECLSDLNIDAFLRITKMNYTVNGLCHPDFNSIKDTLAETYEDSIFVVNTSDGKGFHWLTISNIDCPR